MSTALDRPVDAAEITASDVLGGRAEVEAATITEVCVEPVVVIDLQQQLPLLRCRHDRLVDLAVGKARVPILDLGLAHREVDQRALLLAAGPPEELVARGATAIG